MHGALPGFAAERHPHRWFVPSVFPGAAFRTPSPREREEEGEEGEDDEDAEEGVDLDEDDFAADEDVDEDEDEGLLEPSPESAVKACTRE